jgi:hypothetical protein
MSKCIKCEAKAIKKYNQLKEMCNKHYNEIVEIVKLISKKPR